MMPRDLAIIKDLERFRAMTVEDVADLHFKGSAYPVTSANKVMLRLVRERQIVVSKERRLYCYFPPNGIKRDSTKIPHYLAIVAFYRELCKHETPIRFDVEPKLGEKKLGLPEPDAFMIWKRTPMYVEIQRSVYSVKQWRMKFNRYETWNASGRWKAESWQPADRKIFPMVWVVSKSAIPEDRPKYFRTGSVEDVLASAPK